MNKHLEIIGVMGVKYLSTMRILFNEYLEAQVDLLVRQKEELGCEIKAMEIGHHQRFPI